MTITHLGFLAVLSFTEDIWVLPLVLSLPTGEPRKYASAVHWSAQVPMALLEGTSMLTGLLSLSIPSIVGAPGGPDKVYVEWVLTTRMELSRTWLPLLWLESWVFTD
jgi:hypothetical protein